MPKKLILVVICLLFSFLTAAETAAQKVRRSVSGAEVTGTFVYNFAGRYKGNSNEIKILALGGGRLKIAFDLIYPYKTGDGTLSANVGQASGEALISGDAAVFVNPDDRECVIKIKFVRAGLIRVSQEGSATCGFGFNVNASGTYRKISGKKPKFDDPL